MTICLSSPEQSSATALSALVSYSLQVEGTYLQHGGYTLGLSQDIYSYVLPYVSERDEP